VSDNQITVCTSRRVINLCFTTIIVEVIKTVTRNSFRACFVPSFPSLSFPHPSFPFPLSFPRHEVAFQIQLKDLGEHCHREGGRRTTFAVTRHILWALNTPEMCLRPSLGRKHIFNVFRAQQTCLVAANLVVFLLNEILRN